MAGGVRLALNAADHPANKEHTQTRKITNKEGPSKSKREKLTLWDRELEETRGSLEQQRPAVLQC